jgi:hypothetical protein
VAQGVTLGESEKQSIKDEEKRMSVATVLSTVGNDLKSFYTKLSADFQKARQAWLIISSAQTRAILLTVGSDAIKTVQDATAAVEGGGFSVTLDAAVIADIKQLIADAKTGDGVIAADLKALGLVL